MPPPAFFPPHPMRSAILVHVPTRFRRREMSWRLAALALIPLALAGGPAAADNHASLNFRGLPGLIDMPSGASLADADASVAIGFFGPVRRGTFAFQISPRLEAAFRYNTIGGWNNAAGSYYEPNFDLRYRIVDPKGRRPSVVLGLQDFLGNGLDSAEYIAATGLVGSNIAVTAGLGWGRLGSFDPLFSMGSRPAPDLNSSGRLDLNQYFRGPVAAFGGLEWAVTDRLTAKLEYSSDAYAQEAGIQGAFARKSPINFGLEYKATPSLTFGAYSLYGSEIGISANMVLNARERIGGPLRMPAPEPVRVRPPRAGHADDWSTDWIATPDAATQIREALSNHLESTGITVVSVSVASDSVQVRYRNTTLDAEAQAIGLVARAMSQVLPASVETFRIVPMVNGMPATEATVRRGDLEKLEFAPDAAEAMRRKVSFGPAHAPGPLSSMNPKVSPALHWSISPYVNFNLFDSTYKPTADAGLRAEASYVFAPGLILSGSVTKVALGHLSYSPADPSPLPPVRRDFGLYETQGDPAVESLTAAWYANPAPNLYSRLTVGYLERMFAGVSSELLWRPTDKPFALGIDANYVAQRDPNQGFGFSYFDYRVATGHVSGYYDFGHGYHAELDLGRYLAGDYGGTLTLSREFANGWKVGAFATLTNVSPGDFGDGSFDKGITIQIPMSWLLGNTSRNRRNITLRPFTRDGGARLDVNGRLYSVLHSYDTSGIDGQWDRFWR